jgi:hypothetical protein
MKCCGPGRKPGSALFYDTRSLDIRARNRHEVAVMVVVAMPPTIAMVVMMMVQLRDLHAVQVFG